MGSACQFVHLRKSKFPLFTACGRFCSARPQETLYSAFPQSVLLSKIYAGRAPMFWPAGFTPPPEARPARLRRTFQERNALMKGASPFMTDRSRQDSPLSDGSPRFPASTPQFCSPFPLPRPFGNAPAALPVHPAEKSVCLQMLTDPFGYPESCPENIMFKIRNFHSIS